MSQYGLRVGKNISKYRAESHLTLKEVAHKVGITEATMQKYEAGNIKRVDIDMLSKIAAALGVKPEKLVEWESKEEYEKYRTEKSSKIDDEFFRQYKLLTKAQKETVRLMVEGLVNAKNQKRFAKTR